MDIDKAFKRLLIKSPFYGLFCLSLPKTITRSTSTLCVIKKGINCELRINPDFFGQHTDDEQIALLEHELSHLALQHPFISDSFSDKRLFNISADCEVNSYIENLPASACKASAMGLPDGQGTKFYYESLQKKQQQQQQAQNPQKPCNGGQGGQEGLPMPSYGNDFDKDKEEANQSSGEENEKERKDSPQEEQKPQEEPQNESQDPSNNPQDTQEEPEEEQEDYSDILPEGKKPIDDHSKWSTFKNIPEATKQLMVNNLNAILVQTAEQIEKQRGTIPGNLVDKINKLREKKPEIFNWKAYFRRLLGSIYDVNIRSTRRKESKRFEGSAGIQHKKKVSILVAVDTSASVSKKELEEFFSEIEYIYKAGARVTILQCDTQINSVTEYDGKNIPDIKGRGGTSFQPPIDYYIKNKKEYASLIYFTDGECNVPTQRPSGVVWVITSNGCHQEYFGKVIYIPKDNDNNREN